MSSLIDKLSTLVNAQVNELLGRNPRSPLARVSLKPQDAAANPRQSATRLRQRLDEAIAYEDELQAKIDRLVQEALDIDEQVDAALKSGDSYESRRAQARLNAKQQQVTIAESELRDHRLVTRHLMQELVRLESSLDERERAGARIPLEDEGERGASPMSFIADAADRVNQALGVNERSQPQPPARAVKPNRYQIVDEAPDPRQPKPQGKDASDMTKRLSRLSGADDD